MPMFGMGWYMRRKLNADLAEETANLRKETNLIVLPFAVETLGPWCKEAKNFTWISVPYFDWNF